MHLCMCSLYIYIYIHTYIHTYVYMNFIEVGMIDASLFGIVDGKDERRKEVRDARLKKQEPHAIMWGEMQLKELFGVKAGEIPSHPI